MAYILQNTLAALLEFPGATLLGVNRMYIDKEYRKNVIAHVTDPATRSFWVDEYSKYTDRYAQEATPAIQNKIGQFAANALVRNIIGQAQSAFDVRDLMDNRKIFIANLSKGRMGEGNANLLGSMLITKIYLSAMSRADAAPSLLRELPPFYLFVDEFQNFANKSFADILSEARKYKLALTVAHQYIEQMEDEVRAAVFGNVGTMMTFRVGSYDAEVLEKEFAPVFTADDLVNLGRRQIYLKLMIDGVSSQPFSAATMAPIPEPAISHRDRAIAFSRAQYSRPRAEVEKAIADWTARKYEDPEADEKERARLERRAAREAEENRPPGERMQRPATREEGGRPPRPREREQRGREPGSRERVERSAQRERRDGRAAPGDGTRRPQVPRVEVPKQEPKADLKQFLGALRKQATEQQPAREETQHCALPGQRASDAGKPAGAQQARAPGSARESGAAPQGQQASDGLRDDGKGISPEGREELRNLLSKLRETSVRQGAVETPRPKNEQPQQKQPQIGEHNRAEQKRTQSPHKVSEATQKQHAPVAAPTHETHVPVQQAKAELGELQEQHTTHVPVSDANPHVAEPVTPATRTPHVPVQDATPHSATKATHETHVPVADANPHSPRQQAEQVPVTHKFVKVEVPRQTPPKAQAQTQTQTQTTHVPVEDVNPHQYSQKEQSGAHHTTHVPVTDVTPRSVPVEEVRSSEHAEPKPPGIPVEELRRRLQVKKPDL